MSARRSRVDWRGWRSDVARRLDRAAIVGASAFTLFCVALMFVHFDRAKLDPAVVAACSLYWLIIVAVTVLALAASMVAVARGARAWVAYMLACVVIVAGAAAADLAFDPYAWKVGTASRHFPATVVAHLTILSMLLAPAAIFYVCASNAAHHARLLRSLDIERAAETERLVQQRLQTELATIDHDLVLTAMRLALPLMASKAAQEEELLGEMTAYLRVAHQRGPPSARVSQPRRELRQLCMNAAEQLRWGDRRVTRHAQHCGRRACRQGLAMRWRSFGPARDLRRGRRRIRRCARSTGCAPTSFPRHPDAGVVEIELARQVNGRCHVVFVTAFDAPASQAFARCGRLRAEATVDGAPPRRSVA
jgi:hypothetical protein